jgi:dTDP-4-dehydrorhamnose reductase
MVGSNLAVACRERGWNVAGTYNATPVSVGGCDTHQVALGNPEDLMRLIADVRPDVIIHSAARVELSALEVNEVAVRSNVAVTNSALSASELWGCLFVLVSSDWVFPGDLDIGLCYDEKDRRSPVNGYGRSKARSEELVEGSSMPFLITRPANVYGLNVSSPLNVDEVERHIWTRSSLALRLLRDLREGRKVLGPESLYQNPTSAWSYSQRTCDLIEAGVRGIVNTAGPTVMSRLKYLKEFASAFDIDTNLIRESDQGDMLRSQGESPELPLPQNCGLSDALLREIVGPTDSVADGLRWLRGQLSDVLESHGLDAPQ